MDDPRILQDVYDELRWDPRACADDIQVRVSDGMVTLSGSVPGCPALQAAVAAATRVRGVRSVEADLYVDIPEEDERSDSEIARAADSVLAWNSLVPENVQAEVENGQVTLSGEVEADYQRRAAEDAIRPLRGVRGVTNAITLPGRSLPASARQTVERAIARLRFVTNPPNIHVKAHNGHIALTGSVDLPVEREMAEQQARLLPGMDGVDNCIQVPD